MTHTLAQDRFGVLAMTNTTPRDNSVGIAAGVLAKGLSPSASPGIILPRFIREDVHALAPPEVTDLEVEKGLLHLVNRRLLPMQSDLTPAFYGEQGEA